MYSPLFSILFANLLEILQKQSSREVLKNTHFGKIKTTAPFQLKITLDTDYSVAVDSQNDLKNTKIGKFEGF